VQQISTSAFTSADVFTYATTGRPGYCALNTLSFSTVIISAIGHPALVAPDYAAFHPAWASALKEGVHLTLAPETASWGINRYVLQDAYQRIYDLDSEYFPNIIDVLKQTLYDYTGRQP
jgi:hypothetical protein